MMSEKCPHCNQFHSKVCSMPQGVCFRCGQTRHVKKYYSMLSRIGLVSQSSTQPTTPVQGFGRLVVQPSRSSRSMASNSSGTQGVQRPQMTQTCIFTMTTNEAQTKPACVLSDSGFSRSFVSSSFALHADRDLSPLKNKLVVTTQLGEQILHTSIFKGCEILIKGVVLKTNLIPLEMSDFDVILRMDWLSNYRASMDGFTKKIVFKKSRYPKL